jgi:hypothetical protein
MAERIVKRKRRSKVWTYFKEESNESHDGDLCVSCVVDECKERLRCKNGNTTIMWNHLHSKHKISDTELSSTGEESKEDLFTEEKQRTIDQKLYVHLLLFVPLLSNF